MSADQNDKKTLQRNNTDRIATGSRIWESVERRRRPKELSQQADRRSKKSSQRETQPAQNQGQRQKESGQNEGQNRQNQGQNREEPGQGGPFMVAGATRVDNEAATLPHPKEERPQK